MKWSSSFTSSHLGLFVLTCILTSFQYEYLSTIGFYDTPVPNLDFLALGVTFGTLEEFAETEVKARFA
jgi:hypothetical protein